MNDIITFMEKTILIAGKEYPEGSELASGAVLQGNTVVITSNPVVTEIKPEEGVTTVNWNKISALSSRSLIISALNVNGHLDEAVLVFLFLHSRIDSSHLSRAPFLRTVTSRKPCARRSWR